MEEDLRGVEGQSNYDQETLSTEKNKTKQNTKTIAVVGANTFGAQVVQSAVIELGKKSRLIKMRLIHISFYGRGLL